MTNAYGEIENLEELINSYKINKRIEENSLTKYKTLKSIPFIDNCPISYNLDIIPYNALMASVNQFNLRQYEHYLDILNEFQKVKKCPHTFYKDIF